MKKRKINYLDFNKGTVIFLIGTMLLIFSLLSKLIIGSIEVIFYFKLFSYFLIYLGLIFHLVFINDQPFTKSWKYLKESKKFVYWIIGIFFFFALVGFFVPVPEAITNKLAEIIQELIAQTEGLSVFGLIRFIFFNNLWSSFIGMVFGFFFGVFSILVAVFNGYLLGFVSSLVVVNGSIFVLWKLLPHGVFELPAVFISLGLGFKLGLWLILEPIKFYWKENKLISFLFVIFYLPTLIITLITNKKFNKKMLLQFYKFKHNFWNSIRVFLTIIFPLLFVAAIIEGLLISLFG